LDCFQTKEKITGQQQIKKHERKKQRFCRIYSTISILEQTQDLYWVGVGLTEVTITRLSRQLTTKQKFSKWRTGNRNENKKEINEGDMQLTAVTWRKSPAVINLHWNNWPVYLTTTAVVLIVLRKRNSFRAYVNRQEMQ